MLTWRRAPLSPTRIVVLGVTGNIASGKALCCRHLHALADVRSRSPGSSIMSHTVDADKIGREIYLPGKPCYNELLGAFGREILASDGAAGARETNGGRHIDRKKLGAIVFRHPQSKELRHLNNICWPHIQEAIEQEIDNATNNALANKKSLLLLLLKAGALMESSVLTMCDDLWIITCKKSVAVQRVMERDSLSMEQAEVRVDSQKDTKSQLKFLSDIKFKGEVRTFDTSDESLSNGLRPVTDAFESYWRLKLQALLNDSLREGCGWDTV